MKMDNCKFASSSDELFSLTESDRGWIRFLVEGNHIDFKWVPNGTQNLVVFFTGAVRRDENRRLPAFSGHSAVGRVSANILMVSDPSLELSDDLTLGWYGGTENFKMQPLLGKILKSFSEKFGRRKTILYGGSAGGFASLYYATYVPGAIAVSTNPQTNLVNYYPRLVLHYLRVCFPSIAGENLEEKLKQSGIDYEVMSRLKASGNRFIYFQNISDEHHVENHMIPFLSVMGVHVDLKPRVSRLKNQGYLVIGDWGEKHAPLPKGFVFKFLEDLVINEYFSGLFSFMKFKRRVKTLIR